MLRLSGQEKLSPSSLKNDPLREGIEEQGGLKLTCIDPPFDGGADFFCVRKGTRVLCAGQDSPPPPPQAGGTLKGDTRSPYSSFACSRKPSAPPACRGSRATDATSDLPPACGGVGPTDATSDLPPACGGGGGDISAASPSATHQVVEVPIERLKVGDMVYSHDGKPHKILETFRRTYSGSMFQIVGENGKSLCLTEDHLVLTERRVKHLTPSGQWSGIPRHHFGRARAMRQAMSPPELAVWCSLLGKQMGVKFRKQHPIGPYIADFYSHECGLVVEIDGEQHFETEEAQSYDRERDAFMENLGLIVLRFSAYDVGANLEGVLASIYRMARQHTLKSDPEKQWCFAEALRPGDTVYAGVELCSIRIEDVTSARSVEEVFDIKVDDAHAYITHLCVIHNCGAVAPAAEPADFECAGCREQCTDTRPALEEGRND